VPATACHGHTSLLSLALSVELHLSAITQSHLPPYLDAADNIVRGRLWPRGQQVNRGVRLAVDMEYLSFRQYEYVSEEISQVGKLLGGWLRKEI